MRLANGIVIDKEATFGNLKFSTLRREVYIQNEDGTAPLNIRMVIAAAICLTVAAFYYQRYIDYIKQLFHRQKRRHIYAKHSWELLQNMIYYMLVLYGKQKVYYVDFIK